MRPDETDMCCPCGEACLWNVRSQTYVCPWIDSHHATLVGHTRPKHTAYYKRLWRDERDLIDKHYTGFPGELIDSELEITVGQRLARGEPLPRVHQTPEEAAHQRRVDIEYARKTNPFVDEKFRNYQCADCGFRSASLPRVAEHLQRVNHSSATNGEGKTARVVSPTQVIVEAP